MRVLSRVFSAGVLLACSLLIQEPALAQVGPKGPQGGGGAGAMISRMTPEQLAAALSQTGYPSQVKATQDNKNKYVLSKMGELNVQSWLWGDCNNQGCLAFDFVVWFEPSQDLTVEFANSWNHQMRMVKAALDTSDGYFSFETSVILSGGVTMENVKEHARFFDAVMKKVNEFQP
jgi:hypothetical protein